jgi:hypothetical protein
MLHLPFRLGQGIKSYRGVTFVDPPRLRTIEDERLGRKSAREKAPRYSHREAISRAHRR